MKPLDDPHISAQSEKTVDYIWFFLFFIGDYSFYIFCILSKTMLKKATLRGVMEMGRSVTPTLYIRLRKQVKIAGRDPIRLGQVAQIITEPELEQTLLEQVVYRPADQDGNLLLIDMMRIVKAVKQQFPDMSVECFGQPHTIVEITGQSRRPNKALVVCVWLLLFFGSGLAIMNFHEDVSMPEVHRRIYELITGKPSAHPYILQIPYSLGIGAGMILFFNHLFKKKLNEEPSPLEVEMFMYQENLNQYVVAQEYAKMQQKSDAP